MTVGELVAMLSGYDPELEVRFAYNYGDHWRTRVAAEVNNLDEGYVEYSSYHSMDKVADEPDLDEETGEPEPNDKVTKVIILSV